MSIEKSSENYNASATTAEHVRLTIPIACAGLRLDQVLARLLPDYSRSRLARWIRDGLVKIDGRAAAPRHKVVGGEAIELAPFPKEETLADLGEDIPLDWVHEDDALLVVNKPAGLVVHPGSGNRRGTLLNALLHHAPALAGIPRAGIVHRLDKDTSGLLVVAKTLSAQAGLARQLLARSMKREYLAVVHGRPPRDGKVEAPIGRHPVSRIRMAVTARGRPAATHFQVLERYERAALLRCRLETGRTHQIRVHLTSLGHPLVGDATYGKRASGIPFPRQALHAEHLALMHPATGKAMSWQVDPPADMRELIARLRENARAAQPSAASRQPPGTSSKPRASSSKR
jgi:23S rRNA pseudouridine1911/1915/1917 synthase